MSVLDAAVHEISGMPPRPARRMDELPGVRSVIRQGPARTTRWGDRYYELLGEVRDTWNAAREYREAGDMDRLESLTAARGHLLVVRQQMEQAARQLSALRKNEEAIWRSEELTPAEKQARLQANWERRNAIYARVRTWEERIEQRRLQTSAQADAA
jgi:hypothetical protein